MHICFVTTGDIKHLATGKRATGMAGPLLELGHEVSIIIQDTETNRARLELECPGVQGLFFPRCRQIEEISLKRSLLRKAQPDVVYICAFGVRNSVVNPLAGRRPLFVVEHSELRSSFSDEIGTVGASRERFMEYCSLLLCDGQLCASRYLEHIYQQRLRRLGMRRPLLYSPYAYNDAVMVPRGEVDEALRQRFAGRRLLIYMGSFFETYGVFHLLAAMKALKARRPETLLLLIGRGPDEARVRQYVADHGLTENVQIEGFVAEEDLPRYFEVATAFVSPLNDTVRDWARCPSKLYMYLPFERPVVTCRIGEAAELFGESGFYYPPGDVEALAERLAEALCVPETWRPDYGFEQHAWRVRVREFVDWIEQHWDVSGSGRARRR